ncbi:MAG: hypothetical protein ACOC89_03980, partial [Candidatus Saliniplasma sp.]
MLKKSRLVAVFIVLLMLISVFTMLANPAESAAVSDEENELTPSEEHGWLSDLGGDIDTDDERPYRDVFVGQKDVDITPEYTFNQSSDGPNYRDGLNISHMISYHHEDLDLKKLREGAEWESEDELDWETVSSADDPFDWIDSEDSSETHFGTTDEGIFPQTNHLPTLRFDVDEEASTGIYRIPLRLRCDIYNDSDGTWGGQENTIEYIYLELSGNAEVDDITLDPGMEFETVDVEVENIGDFDLRDVFLTLEENDLQDDYENQVTIHNPDDTSYVSEIEGEEDFNFRFSVPFDMAPGEYEVDYIIESTLIEEEEEVEITEHGTITVTITPQ